ncbi:MAG: hypothetical protein AAB403_10375 [Planctomycetota bacterium]
MTHSQDTEPRATAGRSAISDGLWQQLGHAVSLDTSENQVVWTIFGLFWAADAILLVALFTTGDIPKPTVGMLVSAAGAVLSAIWYLIQKRAIGYLEFYDGVVDRLERQLGVPTELALSGKINTHLYESSLKGSISIRPLMNRCAFISAVLWIAAFFGFWADV